MFLQMAKHPGDVIAVGQWLHGEAVSAGTVMAADMSHRLGWIGEDVLERTRTLLQRAKLPVEPPRVRVPFGGLRQTCAVIDSVLARKRVVSDSEDPISRIPS